MDNFVVKIVDETGNLKGLISEQIGFSMISITLDKTKILRFDEAASKRILDSVPRPFQGEIITEKEMLTLPNLYNGTSVEHFRKIYK